MPILFILLVESILLAWWKVGDLQLEQAIYWIPASVAVLLPWAIAMHVAGRGSVVMSAEDLRIKSLTGTKVFNWDHIADAGQEPIARWLVVARFENPECTVVALRLSRPWRIGFHPWQSGTGVVGMPTGVKTFRLKVEDIEGFLSAARSFMQSRER